MRTAFAVAIGCWALACSPLVWAGDRPTVRLVLDKNMAFKPAGQLATSRLSAALTKAGYQVTLRPAGKRAQRAPGAGLELNIWINILRFEAGQHRIQYELTIEAVAPDLTIVAAASAWTEPIAIDDRAAGLEALPPAIDQAGQSFLGHLAKTRTRPEGRVQRLILIFDKMPPGGAQKIKDLLELTCQRVALTGAEGTRATFRAECPANLTQIQASLASGIGRDFDGAEARFELRGKRTLIVHMP